MRWHERQLPVYRSGSPVACVSPQQELTALLTQQELMAWESTPFPHSETCGSMLEWIVWWRCKVLSPVNRAETPVCCGCPLHAGLGEEEVHKKSYVAVTDTASLAVLNTSGGANSVGWFLFFGQRLVCVAEASSALQTVTDVCVEVGGGSNIITSRSCSTNNRPVSQVKVAIASPILIFIMSLTGMWRCVLFGSWPLLMQQE